MTSIEPSLNSLALTRSRGLKSLISIKKASPTPTRSPLEGRVAVSVPITRWLPSTVTVERSGRWIGVNQHRGPRETEIHRRDEALSARENGIILKHTQ